MTDPSMHRVEAAPPPEATRRAVYFISDSTGITAETLGSALLVNFPAIEFARRTIPFVDTVDGAHQVVAEIRAADAAGMSPLVFTTVKHPLITNLLRRGFLVPDEHRLGAQVQAGYRALQRDGYPLEWLYVTGPMLRARYFEATAIPELRLHTASLAARLAAPKIHL